jgi:hypothetical protein
MHNEYLTAGSLMLFWHIMAPACMYYLGKISRTQEHENMFIEIGTGIKLFALRGIAVFIINTAFIGIGILAINFYRTMNGLKIPMLILGGVGVWIILVFLLMQIYLLPIMVLDEKRRIFISYKKALIMTMSSPFSTSTIGLLIGYFFLFGYVMLHVSFGAHPPFLLAMAMLFPIFLMPFLSLVYIIIMQLNAAIMSYEKHNIYPSLKEFWEARTLSNIFKPWEQK